MGAYQINPNLLSASISRDTRGYADGIIGAGNAIGGALQAYGQRKNQMADAERNHGWQQERDNQQHEWGVAQDERNFEQGMQMQDRSFGHQESMQQTAQERAKQEKQDEADGQLYGALMGYKTYPNSKSAQYPEGEALIPAEMADAATGATTPAQKKTMAEIITNYGSQKIRERIAQTPWEREVPGGGGIKVYGSGPNVMGSVKPPAAAQPVPEDIAAGLKDGTLVPSSWDSTTGRRGYVHPRPAGVAPSGLKTTPFRLY